MSLVNDVSTIATPKRVDDFRALLNKRSGIARNNRYSIVITPPSQGFINFDFDRALTSLVSGTFKPHSYLSDPRDIALLCTSTSFPGRQVQTSDYSMYRNPKKVPVAYFNEDITMNFHLTGDYYAKNMFDEWQGLVIDPETYLVRYENEYKSDVLIHQLNHTGFPVHSIRLKNAYPVGVNSVELSAENDDSVPNLSVTFAYDDFELDGALSSLARGVTQQLSSIIGNIF